MEYFAAVLEYPYPIGPSRAYPIDIVRESPEDAFPDSYPGYCKLAFFIVSPVKLENADLMSRNVSHVDDVLHGVPALQLPF